MGWDMPASYDAWLEAPYQEAYAAAEEDQYVLELLAEGVIRGWEPCDDDECTGEEPCRSCVKDAREALAEDAAEKAAGV